MKKITTILTTMVLSCAALLAQAPSKFSYQAVVRNSSGVVVPSGTSVSFRFTIRDGSAGGAVLFQETQIKTTNNAFGLVNLEIGAGTVQQGAYPTASQWASGAKFLQVEVDPSGGASFSDMGATQISAVPYANYANAAGSANNLSGTVQPSQITAAGASSGQVLQYNGSNWVPGTINSTVTTDNTLAGNGTVGTPLKLAQNGASTGQVLQFNGTSWVPVTLTADITEVNAGTGLSGGGTSGSVTLNANTTSAIWNANALQGVAVGTTAPASGQILKYNGSTWAPAADDNTTYSAGTGLSLSGTTFNSVWTTSGNTIYNNNTSNVGIGTTTPNANSRLHVKGTGTGFFEDQMVEGSYTLNGITLKPTSASTITGMRFAQNSGTNSNAYMLYSETGSYTGNFVISTDNLANTSDLSINKSTKFVGIGKVNASYELDVEGKLRTTKDAMVEGKMSIGTTATPIYSQLVYGSPALTQYQSSTTGTNSSDGLLVGHDDATGNAIIWNWEDKFIKFGTNGTERMRILNTGEIGIGTNTPSTPLDVRGSVSSSYEGVNRTENTNSSNLTFAAHNKGAGSGVYSEGKYVADWAITSGSASSTWALYGNTNSTGTVSYGVYGFATGASTNYAMYCAGNGVYSGTWTSTSDLKLKKEIAPITGGLATIMSLNPKSYLFRTDDPEFKTMNLATGTHYGFIAQELELVVPSVVSNNVHVTPENPDKTIEFKGVNYTELIPILTQAIQEQQAQIETLKKEVEVLKAAQK